MTLSVAGSCKRFDRMKADRRAQMPFSVIAVLLLVISSISVALLYDMSSPRSPSRIPQEKLEEMVAAMDAAIDDVVRIAYSSAVGSVRGTTHLNGTALQERFLASFNESLARTFPLVSGDIRSSVTHNMSLTFLLASVQESFARMGEEVTSWQGASVPAYFVLNGNCSLRVACPEGELTRTVEMDRNVYVPLPLIAYKLDRMSSAAAPRGEIESLVQYELAALAQDRVLRGYGSEARTGAGSTEVILTAEDVVRAVNLAVLLTELRYFQDMGTVDDELETIEPLLHGLEGEIDPADLFLRSYEEEGLDLAAMVGQALYARADAIVLKWMDYLGLIDLVNLEEDMLEDAEDNLFGVLDMLTGGDHDQAAMSEYIARAMADAGYQEYNWRWYCYGGGDILVDLPPYKMTFMNDIGEWVQVTFKGKYDLDFPEMDVLSLPEWGDIREAYRSETHAIAAAMKNYIETICYGIATHCHLSPLELDLDPADGRTYLDEINKQLDEAFRDGSGWVRPAIERANEAMQVREGLAQAAMDFIDRNWMRMLQVNRSLTLVAMDFAKVLVEEKLGGLPHFSEESLQMARNFTVMALAGDNWGAKEAMLAELMEGRIGPLLGKLNHALSLRTEDPRLLQNMIADAMTSMTPLGLMTALMVKDTMASFGDSLIAQGGEAAVPLPAGGTLLDLADGVRRVEILTVSSPAAELSGDGTAGTLQVSIRMPWQYDRSNTSYPNRHVTDLGSMAATPFLTQWGVDYSGSIVVVVRSGTGGVDLPCSALISLQGSFNIVAFSGWALEGVEYAPTATLKGDIQNLVLGLYDMLASAAEAIGGLSENLFLLLYRIISDLLSCSPGALEPLEGLLASGTRAIEDIITGSMGYAIGLLADSASAIVGGTTIDLHVLGLSLSIVFAPRDSALAGAEDRIRIDMSRSFAGTSFSSSLRVLRLAGGEHTIAVSMDLEADDWSVDLTIDPLTKVYAHQIELRGYMGQYALELFAPEVERVQRVSLSLSDVPGLGAMLRSIPSPLPGTKLHINAGMEMSFNILHRDSLVINEVELNPRGTDRSREWVELYNPGSAAVDLSGYVLETSRGERHREVLSGTIPAHGYYVHQFTGQALDNGDVKGFPLQESVALLDRDGKRVDTAPWLKDLADDGRTWQRTHDGSSQWELRDGTRGTSNGFVLLNEQNIGGLLDMVIDCFRESFEECTSRPLDMGTLRDIVAGALVRMMDRILDTVERTISSLRFYLELGLDDVTGVAGGGITMGLEYDGKAIRDCFEWFIRALGEIMSDPLNPLAAGARAPVPMDTLADHVFVQMGAYMRVGTPDLMLDIVEAKLTVLGQVKISLGTLGIVDGGSETEVFFGVVASGMAGVKLRLGVEQSTGACYDVWLLKGHLRSEQ